MDDEVEVEFPPRRAPTLAEVLDVAADWAIGIGVAMALGAAAARESLDRWRRDRGW